MGFLIPGSAGLAMSLLGIALVVLQTPPSHAQAAAGSSASGLPAGAVATVNGVVISKADVDRLVARNKAQGRDDTPELRAAIKDELIVREVLAQESVKQKLDRSAEAKLQLNAARQGVLLDLLFVEHQNRNPITDAAIRAEYDRQIRSIEERGGNQQYRIRQVVLPNESDARGVIAKIRKGESMESLARQVSVAPSKEQGGLLDWLSPVQMVPAVSSVVVNLKAGTLAAAPILVQGGWNVIRVEEVRPFEPPSLEQSRDQIREVLIREQRAALIRKLRAEAKVAE
jgi:peptidyl-prolyl cis-trans isomerase C